MTGASLVVLHGHLEVAPEPALAALIHPDYKVRFPQWTRVRDCIEGQDQVRDRKTTYLPQREKQSDLDYKAYLERAVFFNATGRTRQTLLSSIFRRPGVERLPTELSGESVTRDGMSLKKVARWLAEEVISVSRAGCLIDLPEEESAVIQPFLSLYHAEHILSWQEERGVVKMVLLAERVLDTEVVTNMFNPTGKWQIRLLALDNNGEYFQLTGSPETFSSMTAYPEAGRVYPEVKGRRLKSIPFQFFGALKNTVGPEKPVLLDIADINLAHYRQYAVLETARAFVGSPIYVTYTDGESDDSDEPLIVSSRMVWELNSNDKAEILEFKGSGLSSLENGLDEKEEQMRVLGARLVGQRKNAAARSSTSDENATAGDDATLLDIVQSVGEGLTNIMKIIAGWKRLSPAKINSIMISLNRHFTAPAIGARELRAIDASLNHSLRPEDIFYLLKEAGLIAEDQDKDDYIAYIEKIRQEAIEAKKPVVAAPVGQGAE